MTEKELHNSLDTSTKVGGYRYKNETIIRFLDITASEQEQIELFPGGSVLSRFSSHPSRAAARQLAKQQRDQRVRSLSLSGKSNKEIAAELGIAPNTVTKILGVKKPHREEALELKKSGMSKSDIANKLGVSERTVDRYLKFVEDPVESPEVSVETADAPDQEGPMLLNEIMNPPSESHAYHPRKQIHKRVFKKGNPTSQRNPNILPSKTITETPDTSDSS